MATADLTVISLGRADASASEYIAEIQRRLAAQDRVGYRMHAMGTSLEGSTEDILRIVAELHAVPFELGVPRVYTVLKLDERRDKAQTLEDKVASVRRRLARQDRVRYVMHAMGTSLEGSTADILKLVGELHAVPFELGIPRVYTVLKLDERRDKEQTLEDKVASVTRLLEVGG